MGISKAATIVATICAIAVVGVGGLLITQGHRPPDKAPAPQTELPQRIDSQIVVSEPTREVKLPAEKQAAASIERTEESADPPMFNEGWCVLRGSVKAPNGDAAPGVKLLIGRTHDPDGNEEEDVPVVETTTLSDGSYRAENLPDGRYVVYAIGPGATGVEIVPLSSETSAETRQDIQMSPSFDTGGEVRNARGEPIEAATVVLLMREGTPVDRSIFRPVRVKTGKDGRYTLDYLWEGSYTIEASAEGYAPSVLEPVQAGTSGNDIVLNPGGSVSGTVTFKGTAEPASGILLVARNDQAGTARKALTDEEGKYLLENLAWETKYTVTVDSESYTALEDRAVTLRDGESATGVDIVLSRGASISGTVTTSDTGEPIPGAKVVVRGPVRREVVTGTDGTYLCGGLRPGQYDVHCQPPEGIVYTRGMPTRVSVGREQQLAGIDFNFEWGVTISGLVTDGAMNGIEGAYVQARCEAGGRYSRSDTISNARGEYLLAGIPRGATCRMYVTAEGHGSVRSEPVPLPSDGNVTDVYFVLEPGATIAGRVVDANRRSTPRVQVQLLTESGTTFWSTTVNADADEQGGFQFNDIGPGTYTFGARSREGGAFLTVLNDPITVRAGESISGIDVVVAEGEEGAIEGYVRDQEGKGILGVLVEAHGPSGRSASAETRVSGHYRLAGLGTGTVQIHFNHENYASASLTDIPTGTLNADIVMVPRGSVAGVVMDAATRQPIPDFSVETGRGGWYGNPKSFHSKAGEFVVKNVEPGMTTLRVSAAGYAPQEITGIGVVSGEMTSGIEFHLSQGNVVRGVVVAASDSRPVAGANVYLGGIPETPLGEMRDVAAVTGADGSFLLKDLGVGQQTLAVKHTDFAPATVGVTVREGQENQVTIQLAVGGTVSGCVTENGVAVSGAFVGLPTGEEGPVRPSTSTDANGCYEMRNVVSGTYVILAHLPFSGPGARNFREQATIEVQDGCITERDFQFRSGTGVIEGYVTENGEPFRHKFGAYVGVSPTSAPGQRKGWILDENGFYRLERLAGDSYTVTVQVLDPDPNARIERTVSVQLAEGDTASLDIEIAESAP